MQGVEKGVEQGVVWGVVQGAGCRVQGVVQGAVQGTVQGAVRGAVRGCVEKWNAGGKRHREWEGGIWGKGLHHQHWSMEGRQEGTNIPQCQVILSLNDISANLGKQINVNQADVETFILLVKGGMPFPVYTSLVLHEDLLTIGAAAHLVVLKLVPEYREGICRGLGPPVEAHTTE